MLSVFLALFVALVIAFIFETITKPRNFPPGPKWYPFLGCGTLVENMTKEMGSQWKALSKLAKQYSTNTLGLKLGQQLVIVVFGQKNIRQVLNDREFEGRPDSFFIRLRCFGKRLGITFTDGPLWREHRQFTMKQLRNVGFGKTNMEKEIQEETINIVKHLEQHNKSVSPRNFLGPAVTNILWKYVAGERVEGDQLRCLLDLMYKRSKAFTMSGGWLNQVPWCRYIFPERSGYALIKRLNNELSDFINVAIQKHVDKKIDGDDFIYSFLKEMENGNEFYSVEQLKTICLDLFIAGSQTSSNVVDFALLTVLRNTDIQEKIYDEISTVLGDDIPSWMDYYRLPLTASFLLEVQRFYTIVPVGGPRRVLETTEIDGYTIPKESTILICLGDLHFDPSYWDSPELFVPERFLNKNGTISNAEHFYPFGNGRRRCPGDSLAKSFIFLTFTGIIQKYKLECCNGVLPSPQANIGLISSPKPYSVNFVPRK